MGKITDVVQRRVPASYMAMCAITNAYYSLTALQDLSEFVQFRLYNTVVGVTNEATAYNPKERELLGILTTLNFIPAAVDYWGDQLSSQTADGVNESQSYFDRRPDLWKIFAQLQGEAQELSNELGVFSQVANLPGVSYGDNGRNILVTEDPVLFPRLHRRRSYSHLPWIAGE
jgi:hypothetical protein